ncbi:metal ABC transporter ATP-binding protein [Streptomonospora nanhaiensis]|uniref:Manganese transport system ATP-binding protein n=1 Tax=Streptomonospora nanhaiensis TaxID=1323731 RepID=A0A853BIP3_9ACTN|nr:metal ABC transporter ATP-binding protein [Streptomonospora nanhaiensis]MBX9391057.1 metal ABC transporter ATP-binding protein [Streptomonospora nanhaiensis]NYI94396.1 manganese transport system ATP-binding protein [Streptomonospora nanhaiensis]
MSSVPGPQTAPPPPAVEVEGATVRYGDVLALDDVRLRLTQGRLCALLGTNGSGKSTLLRTVLGLAPAARGTVRVLGRTPAAARRAGLLGYVPQSEQVDWAFPVRVVDVVMMGRYGRMGPLRRPRRADREAVEAALERTGLTGLAHRQIGALSGGQRKRAFVARGIAQGAQVFLLDEPFAGVDRPSEATIIEVLSAMRDEGHTLLVSTHDLAGVPRWCDEAVLLQRRVVAHGTPEEVLTPERLMSAFGAGPAPAAEEGRAA